MTLDIKVDDVMVMPDGSKLPVTYTEQLRCPKCKSFLFIRRQLYHIHRPRPAETGARLALAKAKGALPPMLKTADYLMLCAGCGRKITAKDMQKQLYPEQTDFSFLDSSLGNGDDLLQKEVDRA